MQVVFFQHKCIFPIKKTVNNTVTIFSQNDMLLKLMAHVSGGQSAVLLLFQIGSNRRHQYIYCMKDISIRFVYQHCFVNVILTLFNATLQMTIHEQSIIACLD